MKNDQNIYVIACENNKFYVGRTHKNVDERFEEHLNGNGSWFTKKYKPIEIIETISDCYPTDELSITIKYMSEYGIENVRGGMFNTYFLSDLQKAFIKDEIIHSENRCSKCSERNHFIKDCKKKSIYLCKKCNQDMKSNLEKVSHEKYCNYDIMCEDFETYDNVNYLLTVINKLHNDNYLILKDLKENTSVIKKYVSNQQKNQCCIIC